MNNIIAIEHTSLKSDNSQMFKGLFFKKSKIEEHNNNNNNNNTCKIQNIKTAAQTVNGGLRVRAPGFPSSASPPLGVRP